MQFEAQVTKEPQKRHEQVFRTGNLSQHERIRRTFNHKAFTEKRCRRSTSQRNRHQFRKVFSVSNRTAAIHRLVAVYEFLPQRPSRYHREGGRWKTEAY